VARFGKFKKGQLKKLEEFASTHSGVEAYLEPRTTTYPESLLLVARGGEWARSEVADRGQAAAFCKKLGVPFYDAAIVGYPERMKGTKGKPAPEAPTAEELDAWFASGDHKDEENQ
jgi:hypothetical protein